MSVSRARLVQLLTPAVQATGHDLEDIAVSPAGKRRVVRLVVDRDGGSTLDDVAEVSRAVSAVLDAAEQEEPDLLAGAYVLEVSSPGVDRPLTEPRHWRRNLGRLVTATLTGVLQADDVEVQLGLADTTGSICTLLLAEVERGAVQVEFAHRADPTADEDDALDEEAP